MCLSFRWERENLFFVRRSNPPKNRYSPGSLSWCGFRFNMIESSISTLMPGPPSNIFPVFKAWAQTLRQREYQSTMVCRLILVQEAAWVTGVSLTKQMIIVIMSAIGSLLRQKNVPYLTLKRFLHCPQLNAKSSGLPEFLCKATRLGLPQCGQGFRSWRSPRANANLTPSPTPCLRTVINSNTFNSSKSAGMSLSFIESRPSLIVDTLYVSIESWKEPNRWEVVLTTSYGDVVT